tara:strand:- start:585 stop:956 length:372 start_codon:yes stop_codon:yes gene_type:complete
MATRAIYTFANFEAHDSKPKHIYVHWDGDPEGAAKYFEDMVHFAELSEPSDPDLLNQFVYVVEDKGLNAVPQLNRLEAGDLEWGYTLTEVKPYEVNVTVHQIENGTETPHWFGTLDQFLTEHL